MRKPAQFADAPFVLSEVRSARTTFSSNKKRWSAKTCDKKRGLIEKWERKVANWERKGIKAKKTAKVKAKAAKVARRVGKRCEELLPCCVYE